MSKPPKHKSLIQSPVSYPSSPEVKVSPAASAWLVKIIWAPPQTY